MRNKGKTGFDVPRAGNIFEHLFIRNESARKISASSIFDSRMQISAAVLEADPVEVQKRWTAEEIRYAYSFRFNNAKAGSRHHVPSF